MIDRSNERATYCAIHIQNQTCVRRGLALVNRTRSEMLSDNGTRAAILESAQRGVSNYDELIYHETPPGGTLFIAICHSMPWLVMREEVAFLLSSHIIFFFFFTKRILEIEMKTS